MLYYFIKTVFLFSICSFKTNNSDFEVLTPIAANPARVHNPHYKLNQKESLIDAPSMTL